MKTITTTTTTTTTTVTEQIDRPMATGENTKFAYLNGKCLESCAYNTVLQQLFVTFRESGNTYRYWDVPSEEYLGLQQAISAGKYYNENIKAAYRSELFC